MITPFDLVLILIVFSFVLFGLWFGLIHAIGGLLGTVAGSVIAAKYYKRFGTTNMGQVISFIVLFVVSSRLVGFIFYLIERALRVVNIIPGIKTINRLAGGILGLVEGSVVVGIGLFFASKFLPSLNAAVHNSQLAQLFISVGTFILPFVPKLIGEIQGATHALP